MHLSARRTLFAAVLATLGLAAVAAALAIHGVPGRSSHEGVRHESASAREREGEGEGGENEAIEVLRHQGELAAKSAAPFAEAPNGALAAAAAAAQKKPKTGNAWVPVGTSPLYADNPDYRGGDPIVTSGPSLLGWSKLSGRITSFAYDPGTAGRVFAAPAAGGVWETTDGGSSWRSIGDNLPTQAMGSVGFSRAGGGTIIAATGDNAVGGVITPSGLGVYTSRNDGKTWTKASGVPDGLVAFKVAVDPTNANVDYVATNRGLFRSTDDGLSYANVNLPTPKVVNGATTPNGCQGDTTSPECTYANFVTDVAVQPTTGAVIAALGWVYGQTVTKAGIMQAPQNGIYTSATGAPGSFTFINPGSNTAPTQNGFAPTPVVGRTTLAIASGPNQDHNYVYALVQDATKLQGCIDEVDIPLCTGAADPTLATATYLDGAYVSQDFGKSWSKIMTPEQLRAPGTNSALALGLLGYGPGIQSWYNNWIAVDPTATDPLTHKPTRVVFGLEEIWENSSLTPPTGPAPASWKVIGRYWNACLMLVAGTQCQNASSPLPGTTTHPDQHAGLFVPDGTGGGVTLYAGNDGGAYKQHVAAGQDFSNDNWGAGISDGLHTLQPYDVSIAKDGTMVAGLQDNGTVKISPSGRQDMIFGGDGFFAGIDPDNSNRLVEEYTYGAVNGSTDGGKSWTSYAPGLDSSNAMFATPMQTDPTNGDHLMIGGQPIYQTPYPYQAHCPAGTPCSPSGLPVNPGAYDNWTQVFDLGSVNTSTGVLGTGVHPSTTPRKTSALDLRGGEAYVGWCGPCSVFAIKDLGFVSGIATNVGGSAPPQFGSSDGWHVAAANGLPDRYITSVRIDPSDPTGRTVYATLGGFSSHWLAPGASAENISRVGTGHVFVSHDAGENFTDVSGDLPDAPADWVLPRDGKLIVGTDVGVFISSTATGGTYSQFGSLPNTPVVSIKPDPSNPNRIVAATFGRGVYAYTFR